MVVKFKRDLDFTSIKLEDRRANHLKPLEDVQEEVRLQAIQEIVDRIDLYRSEAVPERMVKFPRGLYCYLSSY
jgi:hypothetical protein